MWHLLLKKEHFSHSIYPYPKLIILDVIRPPELLQFVDEIIPILHGERTFASHHDGHGDVVVRAIYIRVLKSVTEIERLALRSSALAAVIFCAIIILYFQFFTDIKIIVKTVIIFVDYTQSSIGRRNLQRFQQMPLWTAKVVGLPVEDNAVGNEIKRVIATTNALVTRLQQMLVLVDLTKTEIAIHSDDKLW